MIGQEELERRFAHHPPDAQRIEQHKAIRAACRRTAEILDAAVPDGREKSLAMTHLEDAMFWANAGLARS